MDFTDAVRHAVDVDEWDWVIMRWEIVWALANRKRWSIARAARSLGIGRATVTRWRAQARERKAYLDLVRGA